MEKNALKNIMMKIETYEAKWMLHLQTLTPNGITFKLNDPQNTDLK